MRVPTLQWRAILLPARVAVVSILALFVWIQAQQHHLNDRNLRLLRTMSAQIKAKADNFDQAIDHAIESYEGEGSTLTNRGEFQEYAATFAPDLEIGTAPPPLASRFTVRITAV